MNPGSVGLPFDGDPRASYAASTTTARSSTAASPYDHASSAAKVRAITTWGETVARRIEQARPDV